MNRIAVSAYLSDKEGKEDWSVMIDKSYDKEEGYARIILSEMIRLLRQGKTKDEVYEEINSYSKPFVITGTGRRRILLYVC